MFRDLIQPFLLGGARRQPQQLDGFFVIWFNGSDAQILELWQVLGIGDDHVRVFLL